MLSNKQTQRGRRNRDSRKSDRKSNQPLSNQSSSNDDCCNTNTERVAIKNKQNAPSQRFWFLVKLYMMNANERDLKWLDDMIKSIENNDNGDVESNMCEEEIMAKRMLKHKLSNYPNKSVPPKGMCVKPKENLDHVKVCDNFLGVQIITREMLNLELSNNHDKPVESALSCPTQTGKISYAFIEKLIKWDDEFSHLRGINEQQINSYLNKCLEDNCLEKIKIKLEIMDKKISSYKKRDNFYQKKEKKILQTYKELEDARLMIQKYNTYILERQHPYFLCQLH